MTTVWGDRNVSDSKIGIMSEDHVRDVLSSSKYNNDELELIPFDKSPYLDNWEFNK